MRTIPELRVYSETSLAESSTGPPTTAASESTPLVTSPLNRLPVIQKARLILYVSHAFSQFSEQAWQFALILFLAAFSNYESLILVSSYGLVSGLAVCLCGSGAGRIVDVFDRMVVAKWFIWIENSCVLIATALCFLLLDLHHGEEVPPEPSPDAGWLKRHFHGVPSDASSILLLIGIHVLGSVAKILDRGFSVAVERDWVVVMSTVVVADPITDPKIWLSETNVVMKQINLSCKVVAPAIAGFVVAAFDKGTPSGGDLTGATILVGVLNATALVAEYVCMRQIYRLIPELALRKPREAEKKAEEAGATSELVVPSPQIRCGVKLPHGLGIYLEQPISWAGLGLGMLYLNALTFGGLMTAYLVWRGMRVETVGVWRGVSSAVGLAGTFIYNISSRRMTLVQTGMWSVVYEFFCLSLSFASLFVSDFDVSMIMLVAGVCASRIGLWVFDISVTQLMQEFIPDGVRGVVGGTQQAINSFFSLLSFGLGLVFPNPRSFPIYVASGYTAVGLAVLMFGFGVFVRGQEFKTRSERQLWPPT